MRCCHRQTYNASVLRLCPLSICTDSTGRRQRRHRREGAARWAGTCRALYLATVCLAWLVSTAPAVAWTEETTQAQAQTQATLYVFFATWCVPCRSELPHAQRFFQHYGKHGDDQVSFLVDYTSSCR